MITAVEKAKVLVCENCSQVFDEESALDTRLYECSSCGHVFNREEGAGNGATCPECNKFASRSDSKAGTKEDAKVCPECETAELQEEDGFQCSFCDEKFGEEDAFVEHLKDSHVTEVVDEWFEQASSD